MKKITALTLCFVLALTLFTGCKKTDTPSAKSPVVTDIWQAIVEKVGEPDLGPLMDGDKDSLMQFYGINAEDLDEYVVKLPMRNVNADEYFIAKVKDGKLDDVKKGIEKRKQDLDTQWKQYLPDVYEQVKMAKTIENGNYILFTVGSHHGDVVKIFDEQTK